MQSNIPKLKIKTICVRMETKAVELSRIRQHYRITQDDVILKNEPNSMNTTLELLQAHSPAKNRNIQHNPRKRSSPDTPYSNRSFFRTKTTKMWTIYCSMES